MTRPELEVLRFVDRPGPEHIALVKKLCGAYWYHQSLDEYGKEWAEGALWIWTLGDNSAVVLTRTVKRGEHEYLWIEGIVGAGMIAKRDAIARDLKIIAKEYNCKGILGNALRPGLERLYYEMGARRVSVQVLMEVD